MATSRGVIAELPCSVLVIGIGVAVPEPPPVKGGCASDHGQADAGQKMQRPAAAARPAGDWLRPQRPRSAERISHTALPRRP
eukprot:15448333-Alexandrium_andersonii.AAC.1